MKRYAENRLTACKTSNYGMPGRLIAWLMPVLIIAILMLVDTSIIFAEAASETASAQTSEGASLSAAGDAFPADALAGEGSGQDVTIHFGKGKNRSISIHVNPKNSEEEMESESETENTGLEKVEAGDLVTISSVDGSLLPEEAEASAEILSGRAENKAVEKVEEVSVVEPVVAEPDSDAADSAGSIVQDRKKEESSGAKSASKEESSAEAAAVEKTEYQVFDISLEHVDEEQYQDGFKVEVSLPEDVKGRDFRLYHIHEGEEPVEIPVRTVGTVDSETGLEVVSGFEFQTDGFSEFVLKYTVDFEYNDPETGEPMYMSVDGGNTYVLADVLKVLEAKKGKRYRIRSVWQHLRIGRFGGLIKHVAPVKLKADGFVLRLADRHFAMTDGQEDYTCSGEALRAGIPLAMQYSGTGYSPDLRILGDWGSSLYVVEEMT